MKLTAEDRIFIEENEEKIRDYVGKNSYYYYLKAWKNEKNVKQNLVGYVFSGIWAGYRGLYGFLILIFSTFLIIDIVEVMTGKIISVESVVMGTGIITGLLGNYLYFKKVKRSILRRKKSLNVYARIFFTILIFMGYFLISEAILFLLRTIILA